jgi:hypothetical protein
LQALLHGHLGLGSFGVFAAFSTSCFGSLTLKSHTGFIDLR